MNWDAIGFVAAAGTEQVGRGFLTDLPWIAAGVIGAIAIGCAVFIIASVQAERVRGRRHHDVQTLYDVQTLAMLCDGCNGKPVPWCCCEEPCGSEFCQAPEVADA